MPNGEMQKALRFIAEQKLRHQTVFNLPTVLGFLGTSARAGEHPAMGVMELVELAPTDAPNTVRLRLRGSLPRPVQGGECITVSITRCDRTQPYQMYQGYQMKTLPLREPGAERELFAPADGSELWLEGAQVYTVHHSPFTVSVYERIPFGEMKESLSGAVQAVVAVGESANVSPRLLFHHEMEQERLLCFHGDGLPHKTARNLQVNHQATVLVVDLERSDGYALTGTLEEVQRAQHPEAWERICAGFEADGWGRPFHVFRLTAERATRVAAPAGRR